VRGTALRYALVDVARLEDEPIGSSFDDTQHRAAESLGRGERTREEPHKQRREQEERFQEHHAGLVGARPAANTGPRPDEAGPHGAGMRERHRLQRLLYAPPHASPHPGTTGAGGGAVTEGHTGVEPKEFARPDERQLLGHPRIRRFVKPKGR
jgi:hypothetical protein